MTEFALNEGNWQVGRKNPVLPNHQLRKLPEGKLILRLGICKNDIRMPHFRRCFKETMKHVREGRYRLVNVYDCQM